MFEQYLADGANIFIAIVATIVGILAAIGLLDSKKESKKEN